MKWSYKEVESLSLSVFNKVIDHLSLYPSVELLVSSYMGYEWGVDVNQKKLKERKDLAEEFKDVNFDNLESDIIIYDETLLERTKNLYKEYEG